MQAETPDSEFVHSIVTALSNCILYSRDHPVVHDYTKKAFRTLGDLFVNGRLSLAVVDGSLLLNDHRYAGAADPADHLARLFRDKGVSRAILSDGINLSEFTDFIAGMASKDPVVSSAHIAVGSVEIRETAPTEDLDIGSHYEQDIHIFTRIYEDAVHNRQIDLRGLNGIVSDFIGLLQREKNILNIIGPFKHHSAYTLVHITNVTILAIFQAQSLGIKGWLLRDIGIAGLLHDIGKLFIPPAVIDKPGELSPAEWEKMKLHPVYGALYLAKNKDIPPIASIVAYEHHMKYDGSGYPKSERSGVHQHLVSQIVTIADMFEALRMDRPYKKSMDTLTIAGILKEGAGKDYNPELVQSFLKSLGSQAIT